MDEPHLSFLGHIWQKRPGSESAQALIDAGYKPLVARILASRGITTIEEAEGFLDAGLHRLHDPRSLKGVDEAVKRIVRALHAHEKIGIYGDYDVDGQTSTALMVRVLGALGAEVETHIPHRTKEGYGLNIPALQELREKGCSLVITVDCGISAVTEAEWAQQNGLDLIITDHHKPQDELPAAVAIVNPQLDPDYPCPYLAGCGVAFKLAEALAEAATGERALAHRWIELVAIGTVADVVPLLGENRSLVRAGLAELNSGGAIPGLQALRAVAGVHTDVTAGHVGFVLAPRLNAVGRVGDPSIGLNLLLAATYDEALPLARRLEEENTARRQLEEEVTDEASRVVDELFIPAEDHGLVVHGEGWHPGVIGIVASRLAERHYRPTVVLSIDGDEARGSARSIPGFDLYQALSSCAELFTAFGGHQAAAGLTLPAEKIDVFRDRFREITRSLLSPGDLIPRLNYECEVEIAAIDIEWAEAFKELEPFGMGNPTPVVVARDCVVRASAIGKEKTHLKLMVSDPASGRKLDGIGFGMAKELLPQLGPETMVDLAFVPDINEWNGKRSPQLRLKDMRIASSLASPAARLLAALEEAAVTSEDAPIALDERDANQEPIAPPIAEVAESLRTFEIIDMRGVPAVHLFDALAGEDRLAVVVPALPELGLHLATEIASLTPALRERSVLWTNQAPTELKQLMRRALGASHAVLVAPDLFSSKGDASEVAEIIAGRKGAIVLWHAPAHPKSSLLHLYRLRALIPGAPLVLATDPERDRRVADQLELCYPDRDRLGRIYIALKEATKRVPAPGIVELAAAVEARWPGIATRHTVKVALEIFAELGLVEVTQSGFTLAESEAKVDLARSLRYNEGIAICSQYLHFAGELTKAAPQSLIELLIERGTPWWPQSTSSL